MARYSKNQRSRIFFWFTSLLVVLSMSLSLVATFVPTRHITPTPIPTYTPFPTRTPTPVGARLPTHNVRAATTHPLQPSH